MAISLHVIMHVQKQTQLKLEACLITMQMTSSTSSSNDTVKIFCLTLSLFMALCETDEFEIVK